MSIPLPKGYHSINPYLVINGAKKALDFYQRAFNGELRFKVDLPEDKIGHAEIMIGDSIIMLADECKEMNAKGPEAYGGTPVSICLYVDNVDKTFSQALQCGAKELKPVTDQFYGDRSGMLVDPFGHVWCIATHMKDVTEEDIKDYFAKMKE
jgi:PhnB protein